MKALAALFAELAGLFVEDKVFALAIALWIAIVGALAAGHVIAAPIGGIVLFAGLGAIVVSGVAAASRTR